MINVFQPTLGDEELAAVKEVFATSWVGKGKRTAAFEQAFARHLGVGDDHVMSVNSCTEATFLAMQLLGVGPGTDVVVSTVGFVSEGNAVAAQGARPVFCDVDPATLNPTVDDVAAALTPKTKAVLLLHYAGYPGDVVEIAELCRERGVHLVEDSACSVASRVDGQACGTIGDIGVWSFDFGKVVVAGDGAILHARDPELVERGRKLAYLGLEQTSGYSQANQTNTRWWEYEISSFSRRSVMNDIQAAIGTVQLGRLQEFLDRRRRIVAYYDAELADLAEVRTPPPLPSGHETSYYMYWVQMDAGIRDEVAQDLYERGIYTTLRYPPLHRVKAYGFDGRLPAAEEAAERTLCLPLHNGLSDADVEATVTAFREAVRARSVVAGTHR
ncbi:DegT/DnrJ/EryC1/StrS family aminotransferase [Actinoalloteichus sp. AHMU CJ021]|uniref:DegT/DnrJ/EryC1/StrS family aminotransferase n=1 Tax=Actinoalloteichus sp. AHMU CJ021 TaxID=2072503 RepID=UPI000CA06D1B|nr:DegT/DnrJ/EryC1/StrS family aminotransferase [Actinoalloteichus sp. AHMU CJ021]